MFITPREAKWQQLFAQAGRAVGVDAAPVDLTLGADERAGALGTMIREDNFLPAARMGRVVTRRRFWG